MKKIIMSFFVVVLFLGMTNIAMAYSIRDDATGGNCTSIGIWDLATKTCTLTTDVYEPIQIDSDYITLDGNRHTVTGDGNGYTASATGYQELVSLLSRTGVMIKNLNVKNAGFIGISLRYSTNNTLIGNTVSNNYLGITLYFSNSNIITDNTAEYNAHAIYTSYSTGNTFTGNVVSHNYSAGFYFTYANNNTLTDNIVSGTTGYGCCGGYGILFDSNSSNNSLTGNIVLNNIFGLVIHGGYNNAFVANTACNNTTWDFFVNGLVTESDNICDKVSSYYPFKCIPCSVALPTVTVTATPNILWPPNHKMVDVRIDGSATDGMSGVASVVISVTDEYGIYNMTVPGFGSTIQLEAWREGTDKNGRVYTITVVATDNAGRYSTATTQVIVPHDMRK